MAKIFVVMIAVIYAIFGYSIAYAEDMCECHNGGTKAPYNITREQCHNISKNGYYCIDERDGSFIKKQRQAEQQEPKRTFGEKDATQQVQTTPKSNNSVITHRCMVEMTRQEATVHANKYAWNIRYSSEDMVCCMNLSSSDCRGGYAWMSEAQCDLTGFRPVSYINCN